MNKIYFIFFIIILTLYASGCASVKKVESLSTPIEKVTLDIPIPEPLQLHDVKFYIITKDNFEDQLNLIDPKSFIAVDEFGYKNLSMNMEKLYNYILQIKSSIYPLK